MSEWYTREGPNWWHRKALAVRRHLDVFGIETGGRVVAALLSEEAAPWNWRQNFPKGPSKSQGRLL